MNIALRNVRRAQQVVVGEFEVALAIGGRNAALIDPEDVHAAPLDARLREYRKEKLRRRTARNRDRGNVLAGKNLVQNIQDVVRGCFGRGLRVRQLMPVNAHLDSARPAAVLSAFSKIGSWPTRMSSSRIKR